MPDCQVVLPYLKESVALNAAGSVGASESEQLSKRDFSFDDDESDFSSPWDELKN